MTITESADSLPRWSVADVHESFALSTPILQCPAGRWSPLNPGHRSSWSARSSHVRQCPVHNLCTNQTHWTGWTSSVGGTVTSLTMSIEEFCLLVGISRSHGYALAARDALPVPVIRMGRRVVVSRVAVERLLGVSLAA